MDNINYALHKLSSTIAIAATKENNQDRLITVSWLTQISKEPALLALSISPERSIYNSLKNSKEVCVSVLSKEQQQIAELCSKHEPPEDKVQTSGIELLPSTKINASYVKDSVANLECKVINNLPAGDHEVFILEVVTAGFEETKNTLTGYENRYF